MKVLISYPFYFVFVHVLFTVLFSSSIGSTGTHARVHSATLNSGTNGHSAPAPAPTDIQVLFDDADEHGVWQQFYAHHHLEKSDSDHEERYAASSTNSSTNSVGKPDDTNDANTGDTRTQCMDTDQNVCIVDKDNNVLQVFSPLRERSATATSSHPEPGLVGHWTFDTTPPFDVSATHQYQVTAWPLQLSGPGRQSNGFSAYSNGSNCYTFLDQHAAYRDELASPDEGRRHDGADSGQYSLLFWIFPFQSAVGDFRNIIHKGTKRSPVLSMLVWPDSTRLHIRFKHHSNDDGDGTDGASSHNNNDNANIGDDIAKGTSEDERSLLTKNSRSKHRQSHGPNTDSSSDGENGDGDHGSSTDASSTFDSIRSLAVGVWTHVALTVEGRLVSLYLNGELDNQSIMPAAATSLFSLAAAKTRKGRPATVHASTDHIQPEKEGYSADASLIMGKLPWRLGFPSYVDDLKLYNTSLSAHALRTYKQLAFPGMIDTTLGCKDCTYTQAKHACAQGSHLCNTHELLSSSLLVARAMGWIESISSYSLEGLLPSSSSSVPSSSPSSSLSSSASSFSTSSSSSSSSPAATKSKRHMIWHLDSAPLKSERKSGIGLCCVD